MPEYASKLVIDASPALNELSRLSQAIDAFNKHLLQLGQGAKVLQVEGIAQQFSKDAQAGVDAYNVLEKQLKQVAEAQKRLAAGETVRLREQEGFPGGEGTLGRRIAIAQGSKTAQGGPAATAAGLATAAAQIKEEMAQIEASMDALVNKSLQQLGAVDQRALQQSQQLLQVAQQRLSVEEQAANVLNTGITRALQSRRDELTGRLSTLTDQQTQMESRYAQLQPGKKQRQEIEQLASARNLEFQALERKAQALERIRKLTDEVAQKEGARTAGILNAPKTVEEAQLLQSALARLEGTALGDTDAVRALNQELQKLAKASADVSRAQEQQRVGTGRARIMADQTGTREQYDQVTASIQRVRQALNELGGEGAAERISPGITGVLAALQRNRIQIETAKEGTKEHNRLYREQAQLVSEIQARLRSMSRAPDTGRVQTPQEMQQALMAQQPLLTRTFTQVFSDMQRRFIATFQFAISGALIFGVQKLAREFIQTAIEVERAFVDIESALEFDIEAPRGSAEFDASVESTRQKVLALADEFNTLPTEANKSAFVMVARFKDVDNAMVALRAQLLAVKVSTIDQSETLRALTAVAEGFASTVFDVNDGLSIQEKLLNREVAAASLYGKALDIAVQIQQKFGVEVEDTLEGTARATEVFKNLGFTIEETAAIVAGTSRELGQTGQQVAERLNRSIGQITDPKIRNALLELAAGSKEFNLTLGDFQTGATAYRAIAQQFERLSVTAPGVSASILQIIGQRRELEAVAAAFGTTQLQGEIVASAQAAGGAAERRFSFLKRTISEVLESIAGQFQELSQNFERLGGISTIKILVSAFDVLLTQLNKMLKFVIDIADWLDQWGFPLGSITTQVIALSASLLGAYKVTLAMVQAFKDLSKIKAIQAGIDTFSAAAAAAKLGGPGTPAAGQIAGQLGLFGAASGGRIAALGAGAAAGAKSLAAMTASAVGSIPVLGQLAIVAGLAAYSLKSLYDRQTALDEAYKKATEAIEKAEKTAARESKRLKEPADEARLRDLEQRITASEALVGVSPSARPGVADWFGAVLNDTLNPFTTDFRIDDVIRGQLSPQLVEGSREWLQAFVDNLNAEMLKILGEEEAGAAADFASQVDVSVFEDYLNAALPSSLGLDFDNLLFNIMNKKTKEANTATAEENFELAYALLQDSKAKRLELMEELGYFDAALELSAKEAKEKMESQADRLYLGDITRAEALQEKVDAAQVLGDDAAQKRALFEEFGPNTISEEEVLQAEAEARRALVTASQGRVENIQAEIDDIRTGTLGREEALRAEWEILNAALQSGELSGEALREIREQIIAVEDELIKLSLARALAEAKHTVDIAVGHAAKQAAEKAYIEEIQRQAEVYRNILGDADQAREFERQAEVMQINQTKKRTDQAKKKAIALVRLQGPILNNIQAIKAQITGIRHDIKYGDLEYGDLLAAQVQLQEQLAQLALAEMERIAALARVKVSVRDSMRQNQLELTLLNRQLELTAKLFGSTSAEWAAVQANINNIKAALMDQALELDSINRRLGTDITDSYVQAQLDLVDALQRQKAANVDGGDLEKARAALDVKEKEMAAIAAFYSDRLFTLKYDFERGTISKSQYISSLTRFRDEVDVSTKQGKELWIEINSLIEGMTEDVSDMQFNIPGEIRLPTLFEVRRSLAADALGVNYQDNRQQDIRIYVASDVDIAKVADAVNEGLGSQAASASARYAPGAATLTLGI